MVDLVDLKFRDGLGGWLNNRGLGGVGLEVGSLTGEYARTVLSTWKGLLLIMLDPWEKQPEQVYKEPVNNCDWESAYKSCLKVAEDFAPRVMLMRGYSPDMSVAIKDNSLDWCYIDARHDYEAITNDIAAWWPKVRSGGVFGGHDYRVEHNDTQCCDVKTAVDEFAVKIGTQPHITRHPGCYSWWFIKP